jgi:acyl-CoA synthetase (AMP-forming)/AMP-acid ligase II
VLAGRPSPVPPAEEIRAWAVQRLAGYKVPERITIVNTIPRNALAKIDRAAITAALSAPQQEPA